MVEGLEDLSCFGSVQHKRRIVSFCRVTYICGGIGQLWVCGVDGVISISYYKVWQPLISFVCIGCQPVRFSSLLPSHRASSPCSSQWQLQEPTVQSVSQSVSSNGASHIVHLIIANSFTEHCFVGDESCQTLRPAQVITVLLYTFGVRFKSIAPNGGSAVPELLISWGAKVSIIAKIRT